MEENSHRKGKMVSRRQIPETIISLFKHGDSDGDFASSEECDSRGEKRNERLDGDRRCNARSAEVQGFQRFRRAKEKSPESYGGGSNITLGHRRSLSAGKSEEVGQLKYEWSVRGSSHTRDAPMRSFSTDLIPDWKEGGVGKKRVKNTSLPCYQKVIRVCTAYHLPRLQYSLLLRGDHKPVALVTGPDEGVYELIDDVISGERRRALRLLLKEVSQHPKNDNVLCETDIEPDAVRRKLERLHSTESELKAMYHRFGLLRQRGVALSDARVYGQTIDTYAIDYMKGGMKPGQPNADSYFSLTFGNRILMGVADGIGWGSSSRRASQAALLGVLLYFFGDDLRAKRFLETNETVLMARHLLRSLECSHDAAAVLSESKTTIVAGALVALPGKSKEDPRSVLLSAARSSSSSSQVNSSEWPDNMSSDSESDDENDSSSSEEEIEETNDLNSKSESDHISRKRFPLSSKIVGKTAAPKPLVDTPPRGHPAKGQWVFVGVSCGDSLAYRWSASTAEVREITRSNRTKGVRDAGGSLGGVEPDLRNLDVLMCMVEEGDIIILCSDGVHDNLDPEVLRVHPKDLGLDGDRWAKVDPQKKDSCKQRYKEQQLAEIIGVTKCSAKTATNKIIEFVTEVTQRQREAFEIGSKLQRDWAAMEEHERETLNKWVKENMKDPVGKFDHVTCLAVQCGAATQPADQADWNKRL